MVEHYSYAAALPETPPKDTYFGKPIPVTPIHGARPHTPNSVSGRAAPYSPGQYKQQPAHKRHIREQPVHDIPRTPPSPTQVSKPGEVSLRLVHDASPSRTAVDDADGYYIYERGAVFANHYVICRQLGQGTFGKVLEAYDQRSGKRVAIKIIRAIPKYRNASRNELRALVAVGTHDPFNVSQCVRMIECFDYRNHVCLVTELLDTSIYDFLKDNNFSPFPGHHILSLARQLLRSVAYIHDLGIVHTDLKPENILLRSSSYAHESWRRSPRSSAKTRRVLHSTEVALIDFGSAVFDDEYHAAVVSTRHYRAPEIILGTGWSFPCDLWSVGCVLVELCTGVVLFQTRDNIAHLAMMEKTLQTRFPSSIIASASNNPTGSPLVDPYNMCIMPIDDYKREQAVARHPTLGSLICSAVPYSENPPFWDSFLDLLRSLLRLDPARRITARDALDHPWIREDL